MTAPLSPPADPTPPTGMVTDPFSRAYDEAQGTYPDTDRADFARRMQTGGIWAEHHGRERVLLLEGATGDKFRVERSTFLAMLREGRVVKDGCALNADVDIYVVPGKAVSP